LFLSDLEVCLPELHGDSRFAVIKAFFLNCESDSYHQEQNDNEKSQSTLNELRLCWSISDFSRGADSESIAEHQPKRGSLLRHEGLLQRRRHVMLQEEEAWQECSRLLQWQGRRGMLLQGRFVPDAQQEDQQLKRQLTFVSQW
jgi:hypothetical protein